MLGGGAQVTRVMRMRQPAPSGLSVGRPFGRTGSCTKKVRSAERAGGVVCRAIPWGSAR